MKKLIVEDGRKQINDEEFRGCDYEEIIIPDSVIEIGRQAFQDCKNLKKITLSKNLKFLHDAAFAGCSKLDMVEIPESLTYLPRVCFADCTGLKSIKFLGNMQYFDHYALYKCTNLEDLVIPPNLTYLGIKCLAKCNKIKKITIPTTLQDIECGALSEMESLERIEVLDGNPKYDSIDEKSLIDTKQGVFMQYAIASKDEEYTVYDYPIYHEDIDLVRKERIYHIADYAFAKSRNLKKLNITGAIESVGAKTFKDMDCPNLKILIDSYSDNIIFNFGGFNENPHIPFTNIELEEGITTLSNNLSELFKNAISVKIPSTLTQIGTDVFLKSTQLKELTLPKYIKSIDPNTFADNILLHFVDFMDVRAKDFLTLQTKLSDESYLSFFDKDNTRIYSFKDGSYFVKVDDYSYIPITKEEIHNFSQNSELVEDEPDVFIKHFHKLSYLYANFCEVFYNIFHNKEIYESFERLLGNLDSIEEITGKKLKLIIAEILKQEGRFDELLLNGLLMRNISKGDLIFILDNMNPALERFLKKTDYLKIFSTRSYINEKYYDLTYIINYCKLLDDYNAKDAMLFNDNIAVNVPYKDQVLLVKYFNKNIKRLINKSQTLNSIGITDLVNLLKVLGVFTDDAILSQKITTFLTEKIFNEESDYQIIGDNIHRVFNELRVRNNVDYEFISFFIENYQELINAEKGNSGFIAKIYNNFEEIKKLSTSNHGSQRRVKVTLDKCLYFFLIKTFSNVTEDNRELAAFLSKFYHEDGVLTKAEEILKEASEVRRNIFTDSNDPKDDIKGNLEDGYSFEWLPKQDWYNLVLGKYCNCCAHVYGKGAGIMLASMINDDVQNLVIKDPAGVIIAKATLYVNRKKGYGIINTIEVNSLITDENKENIIYPAIMQGINEFLNVYNRNNSISIKEVTVGTKQNNLLNILISHGYKDTELLTPINYADYAYSINNQTCGTYNGDASERQLLLYKK